MRPLYFTAFLAALMASQPALAEDAITGRYRLADGPDVAAELRIHADGRFEYALAAGVLDEHAEGRWVRNGKTLALTTQPRPIPPVFRQAPRGTPSPEAPTLHVTWPNGRGIGGVDFRIGFDSGNPVTGYTQEYGWTLPADEHRSPRWIELVEPIHGVISSRYPIDSGESGTLNFVLIPNDIGVVDFDETTVDILPRGLQLHRAGGVMKFVPVK